MAETRAVELKATLPTSHLSVDSEGNLVIKNHELSKKVEAFLSSEEGKNIAVAEYYLLCCTLKKPEMLK